MPKRNGLIPDSNVSIKYRKCKARTGNPNNFIDETGQRYGKLTVLKEAGRYNNEVVWECLCDCKNIVKVRGISLRTKVTKSCGCLQKEKLIARSKQSANPQKNEYKKLAQKMQQQGMSYKKIAEEFTNKNVPTLSGKTSNWSSGSVQWLLRD